MTLVARLRAAFAGLEVRLVLDGHPGGGPSGRIAPRFAVEYSRHREADEVIRDIVVDGARQLGPAGMDTILVVSDDGEVRASARRHGARVEGTGWLLARMERVATRPSGGGTPGVAVRAGTTIGHARPPRGPRPPDDHRGR